MENLPLLKGLKIRAEDNNHRGDAKAQHDCILKALWKKVLHLVRALVLMHPVMVEVGEETKVLSQQQFLLLLNMEDEIVKERKKRSIPGSVQATDNCLFKQEDLKNDAAVAKVNAVGPRWQGMSWERQPHHLPPLPVDRWQRNSVEIQRFHLRVWQKALWLPAAVWHSCWEVWHLT